MKYFALLIILLFAEGCCTTMNSVVIHNNNHPINEVALDRGSFIVYKTSELQDSQWLSNDFLLSGSGGPRIALMEEDDKKIIVTEYGNKPKGLPENFKPYVISHEYSMKAMEEQFVMKQDKFTSSKLVLLKKGKEIDVDLSNIEWRKRSKIVNIRNYLMYGITVPIDIVTLPIQIIWVLSLPNR